MCLGISRRTTMRTSFCRKQTSLEVPLVSDKYKEKKIIKWVPLFEDALSSTFGSKYPLVFIVRENAEVPNVGDYPLTANVHYGASGSMLEELINCLPHAGPIFVMIVKMSS